MRAWHDIRSFTPEGRADAAGLADSVQWVNRYLDSEIARGVAAERIVHAGFPKVGAMALPAYRPFPAQLAMGKSHANSDLPILMCHGRMDPVVEIEMGLEARAVLEAQGYPVEWCKYRMEHEVCGEELAETGKWLVRRFGPALSETADVC